MPNAQRYAFILELRDPFNLLNVVSKDDSLIAVVGSRYYINSCRRVYATAVFRGLCGWQCFNSKGGQTLNC